ncbi:hypothetical protein Dimus_013074 [Dionaea muscipula]
MKPLEEGNEVTVDHLLPLTLSTPVVNKLGGSLKMTALKALGFGERKSHYLDDIAILTRAIKPHLSLHNELHSAAEQKYEKEKLNERIAKLSGGGVVIQVLSSDNPKYGYNASIGQYEDLLAAGIIDPTKVTSNSFRALRAASLSSLRLCAGNTPWLRATDAAGTKKPYGQWHAMRPEGPHAARRGTASPPAGSGARADDFTSCGHGQSTFRCSLRPAITTCMESYSPPQPMAYTGNRVLRLTGSHAVDESRSFRRLVGSVQVTNGLKPEYKFQNRP